MYSAGILRSAQKARAAVRGGKESLACENKEGAHLHLSLSPVDVEGAPRGCVLLIVDVSERYAAERSRREFTANVSHELKTPLTSISGYAEMVSLGLAKPDDVRGFAQKIHDEAGRLIALVDDIMKLSHLDESTPASLPFEPVELYALAYETTERLRQTAEKQNVEITLEGAPVTVRGVRRMLGEAVFNLCDNAIKYNRAGGRVTVSVGMSQGCACLKVADSGAGIASEDQPHIFERFYRADKSHSKTVGGTGLWACHCLSTFAKSMARLCAWSRYSDRGSTFIVTFKPTDKVRKRAVFVRKRLFFSAHPREHKVWWLGTAT